MSNILKDVSLAHLYQMAFCYARNNILKLQDFILKNKVIVLEEDTRVKK